MAHSDLILDNNQSPPSYESVNHGNTHSADTTPISKRLICLSVTIGLLLFATGFLSFITGAILSLCGINASAVAMIGLCIFLGSAFFTLTAPHFIEFVANKINPQSNLRYFNQTDIPPVRSLFS